MGFKVQVRGNFHILTCKKRKNQPLKGGGGVKPPTPPPPPDPLLVYIMCSVCMPTLSSVFSVYIPIPIL